MIPDRNILSRPYPVYWAGFESTTLRLQQAGWEFSASQRYGMDAVGLMMRHQATGMVGCTNTVPNMLLYDMGHMSALPPFAVEWLTDQKVMIHNYHAPDWLHACEPVDMKPQMVEVKDIRDTNLFAGVALTRTKELIVDPNSVPELMDRILELQEPGRQEHFQKMVREAKREGSHMSAPPRQDFHAQIVSIAA